MVINCFKDYLSEGQKCSTFIKVNLNFLNTKIFDFDTTVVEAIKAMGGKEVEHLCLLAREHWVRARQPKRERVSLPGIAKPAINFPCVSVQKTGIVGYKPFD